MALKSIDSIPFNNEQMKFLQRNCNYEFVYDKWELVKKETILHKLSWRIVGKSESDYISTIVLKEHESINN